MTREITVVTPENVTITYEMAGLGSRAVAHLVDLILQGLALLVLSLAAALALAAFRRRAPNSAIIAFISDFAAAFIIILFFATLIGYFIYFEGTRNGQTLGKRWMGLRVVREEGAPVDFSSAVVRNLVRIFEMALFFYVISIFCILFSSKYKRLGDYAAGTIVVKERSPTAAVPKFRPSLARPQSPTTAEAALVRDVDLLTKEQLEAVRRFVERRGQLQEKVQEDVARQIALPIMSRLGISPPSEKFSYANFLEEVYRRSVEERGVL